MNCIKYFLKWVTCHINAAMYWFGFGFKVIPILPGTKKTAIKWDPWLNNQDSGKVYGYWKKHPDHEVGCIVGDNLIVFDADTQESISALADIEERFDVTPKLLVKTKKGEHHYYRRAPGITAKSDSHDSKEYPERIDIKTGRALVILPISTGKSIDTLEAENVDGLSEASQEFIDAINKHNGRTALTQPFGIKPVIQLESGEKLLHKIQAHLDKIDPDCGYNDWIHVAMAIFHETKGSDGGLVLFDQWSSKGKKYKGIKEIESKWRSFSLDVAAPVTIKTLNKMAYDAEVFEVCEYDEDSPNTLAPPNFINLLDKYSLFGMSGDIEKQVQEEVFVLGEIALKGQSTVIYAAPNTGKTLLTMNLLTESIREEQINPTKVYYINVDDTANGLLEKLYISEEYRFHMLAEGYNDFKASELLNLITSLTESGKTQDVIIILDTLKKFTDLMSKKLSSHFGKIIRRFVLKGGTVISLAHTNKNPGQDGNPIYAGTSDIIEDADCAYILNTISEDSNQKVIEFKNRKSRGNVTLSSAYRYSLERGLSYNELLLSVEKVDDVQLISVKHDADIKSDAEVITAIETCINNGINTKMKLAEAAAERAKVSQRRTLKIIEKYTGSDQAIHKWHFVIREHGAKVYKLLNLPTENLPELAISEL